MKLIAETAPNGLNLRWETPDNLPFPLPVEVKINNEIKRVEMKDGKASLPLPQDAAYEIDPNGWLLKSQ